MDTLTQPLPEPDEVAVALSIANAVTAAVNGQRETDADCRRAAFIQGLRDCADFLARHPRVTAPVYAHLNVFVDTREDIAAHALVSSWEKVFIGQFFSLKREFGHDLSLEIIAPRETVCRRVVTGTEFVPAREVEVVEWVCAEPILSDEAAVLR